eukprot:6163469-Amphidinium_carterae.1
MQPSFQNVVAATTRADASLEDEYTSVVCVMQTLDVCRLQAPVITGYPSGVHDVMDAHVTCSSICAANKICSQQCDHEVARCRTSGTNFDTTNYVSSNRGYKTRAGGAQVAC